MNVPKCLVLLLTVCMERDEPLFGEYLSFLCLVFDRRLIKKVALTVRGSRQIMAVVLFIFFFFRVGLVFFGCGFNTVKYVKSTGYIGFQFFFFFFIYNR